MNVTDLRRFGLVMVLGALVAIGPLTIDLYLPALLAIRPIWQPPPPVSS